MTMRRDREIRMTDSTILSAPTANPQPAAAVSARREILWLMSQQEPSAMQAALLAFDISPAPDFARLQKALAALPDALPLLGQALSMDDAGEVRAVAAEPIITVSAASDGTAARQALLDLQTAPWAEDEPPFRAALIAHPGGAVLGLVLHPLAGGAATAEWIVAALTALYHGDSLPGLPVEDTQPPQDSSQDAFANLRPTAAMALQQPLRLPFSQAIDSARLAASLSAAIAEVTGAQAVTVPVLDPAPELALRLPDAATAAIVPLTTPQLRLNGHKIARIPLSAAPSAPVLLLGHRPGEGLELLAGQGISLMAAGLILERCVGHLLSDTAPAPATLPATHRTNDLQALILDELRKALQSDDFGPHDDFFDFGGHSLTATRVVGRLMSGHGIELRLTDLFSHPTAAGLAELVAGSGKTVSEPSETAPLSQAQASLWRAYAAFGYGDIFNIPFALRFLDPVDERVFERAFRDVLERHPALRSLFAETDAGVRQTVVPMQALDQYRWFWTADASETMGVTREAEAGHVFDLSRELPLRLHFLREGDHQVLSMLFHHVVLDEWSLNLMMEDLGVAYAARAAGHAPRWSAAPKPFHLFAADQDRRGPDQTHLDWWADRLRDAPPARPLFRPAGDSIPAGGWVELRIDPQIAADLYALAKAEKASLFNVIYAGIAATLHWLGGSDDLVIGTSASGRLDAEYFDTVGYFTTMVAHRTRIAPDLALRDLVTQVRDGVNESMARADIPLDLVAERLTGTPQPMDRMFEAFIQIHAQNRMNGSFTLPDGGPISFRQIDPDKVESILGLQFEIVEDLIEGQRNLRIMLSYRSDRYTDDEVQRITQTVTAALRMLGDDTDSRRSLQDLRPATA